MKFGAIIVTAWAGISVVGDVHPAEAANIKKFVVTLGTAPACDLFIPAPSSTPGTTYLPAPSSSSGLVAIEQGSVPGGGDPFAEMPALAGKSPYVALMGTNSTSGQASLTYSFPNGARFLNILWGSLGTAEGLVFTTATGTTTISGADITKAGVMSVGQNGYLNFKTVAPFTSVTLYSNATSFELSDLSFGPRPPACPAA
jgi:hypothetical protein